jgi:choline dehydrogenase-like flavoprotein
MAEREGFDVVVVGAGAAGCVVAARLAESGSRSVILLEAGPDLRADLPEEVRDGWHMTRAFDWGYASEPKEFGDVQQLRRVKLLGGTSSIVRIALRGSPSDYDEWEVLGNAGWGFEGVLPHLRRLENDLEFGDQPWHGASGPIPVTRSATRRPAKPGARRCRVSGPGRSSPSRTPRSTRRHRSQSPRSADGGGSPDACMDAGEGHELRDDESAHVGTSCLSRGARTMPGCRTGALQAHGPSCRGRPPMATVPAPADQNWPLWCAK